MASAASHYKGKAMGSIVADKTAAGRSGPWTKEKAWEWYNA